MFVLKMSCIDFNTAMYLLPVEGLQFSTNFYACAASVAYTDVTPLLFSDAKRVFHISSSKFYICIASGNQGLNGSNRKP